MRQLKLFLVYSIIAMSLFSFSLGHFYNSELKVGEETEFLATVRNTGGSNIENVNLQLVVYDLGIRLTSYPFDVESGSSAVGRIYWNVPSEIPKGTYAAKLSASNDCFRDWQHIYLAIH